MGEEIYRRVMKKNPDTQPGAFLAAAIFFGLLNLSVGTGAIVLGVWGLLLVPVWLITFWWFGSAVDAHHWAKTAEKAARR